jgi:hypothetical protein
MAKSMNSVFVWLTDITDYAEEQNLSPESVFTSMVEVAHRHGYECDEEFLEFANLPQPGNGISIEVDDIDGLCISAGIDQDDFQKITVADWLNC